MTSLNQSDFFAGTPCVGPHAGEGPPHVPTTEEEMHHKESTMATAVTATSTIHFDGGNCESEQMSQVAKTATKNSTCRQDPYVKKEGLGKEYSSDPSPYSHMESLEATRIAAQAAAAASMVLADLREVLQRQSHELHIAALHACAVTTTMEHTPQAVTDSVAHIRATN
jgi:hypothetical protein